MKMDVSYQASVAMSAKQQPQGPFVKIVEQPARCALRFRYECEGRSAGSIPGANTTADNKTYPTIQVCNYKGPAVVVVSCVTKDVPYRPHPHNLVGKEGCKKGVCTMVINNPEMICSFTSLGIQCVKRKDVEDSLKLRESIKVDPFRTGFGHKNQASNIDLNVVRLCFQVFIEGDEKDKFTVPLAPVVCEPIYDKKAMSELVITKLSHCSASVSGGQEIILLCDRVTKDDVQVRFFEERNGHLVWEAFGEFQPNDVHKQVAICFRVPRYYDESVQQAVLVQLQLRRPSDMQTSEPRPFQYLPREVDPEGLARKRQKLDDGPLDRYMRDNSSLMPNVIVNKSPSPASSPHMDTTAASSSVIIDDPSISQRIPEQYIHVPRLAAKIKCEVPDADMGTTQHWTMQQKSPQHSMLPPSTSFNFNPQLMYNQNIPTGANLPGGQLEHATVLKRESAMGSGHHQARIAELLQNANQLGSQATSSSSSSGPHGPHGPHCSTSAVENTLTEKLDSLDLDNISIGNIDPSDLMNDINFNNLLVMMDSGNNITFNSSGNIASVSAAGAQPDSLHTPQIDGTSDSAKNLMGSASQVARLHELLELQNQMNKSANNDSNQDK